MMLRRNTALSLSRVTQRGRQQRQKLGEQGKQGERDGESVESGCRHERLGLVPSQLQHATIQPAHNHGLAGR